MSQGSKESTRPENPRVAQLKERAKDVTQVISMGRDFVGAGGVLHGRKFDEGRFSEEVGSWADRVAERGFGVLLTSDSSFPRFLQSLGQHKEYVGSFVTDIEESIDGRKKSSNPYRDWESAAEVAAHLNNPDQENVR
ncbi:hypothetical protein HY025_06365 [Candidatus Daviesbacteria bacterium]|nr:hypothetical protein [Candidatus Daviesbacteria bacterium]